MINGVKGPISLLILFEQPSVTMHNTWRYLGETSGGCNVPLFCEINFNEV